MIVGCQAGRWLPSRDLFAGIPSLQHLYGFPLPTAEPQAAAFHFLIPLLLLQGRITEDMRQLMQVAQFAVNAGIIFYHTRADFKRTRIEEGIVWTLGESLLRRILRR